MKKLANKTTAWKDANGNLHKLEKDAKMTTAGIKLKDLMNRVSGAINNSVAKGIAAPFLTAASWFKENPELVRMLINYKLPDLVQKQPVAEATIISSVVDGNSVMYNIPSGVNQSEVSRYMTNRKHTTLTGDAKSTVETFQEWEARDQVERVRRGLLQSVVLYNGGYSRSDADVYKLNVNSGDVHVTFAEWLITHGTRITPPVSKTPIADKIAREMFTGKSTKE